jgi:dephospho-CoA kinase
MLKVGLTGGLASGKSSVGHILAELGCYLLEADKVGHQLLEPGGGAYAAVVEAFGREILQADGRVDRRKLGAIVFSDPAQLERLNKIVHPLVFAEQERWFAAIAARDPEAIAIIEAAIMVETGSYQNYDRLILAHCREEQQVSRAMARDGLTESAVRARLARQMPLEEKKRFAHYLIDTSGTPGETRAQVTQLHQILGQIRLQQGGGKEAKIES